MDTSSIDTSAIDTGSADTGSADTGSTDTGSTDSGASDGSTDATDSGPADTGPTDAGDPCLTAGCDTNATCAVGDGGAVCTCKTGYSGDGKTCTDINECTAGTATCDTNATCANTVGGYTCTCKTGFSGDGKTCTDVDECVASTAGCDVNATCTNTVGGATCTCKTGYSGDGKTCTDINECTAGTAGCDTNATCANTTGSFTCTCNTGYSGDGKSCTDVNECTAGTATCDTNATCANTTGSYTCTCKTGYSGDGKTCTDINECTAGTAGCSTNATCANTIGSYTCTCNTGYTGDGKTCTPMTSCKAIKTANPSAASGTYTIDPDGSGTAPSISVYCDMTTDGGVGYTMVKITDSALTTNQTAYRAKCAAAGLEVIVPRTKAHALSIRTYNGGTPPNLVNVFPKTNGVAGLSNFQGICKGAPCSFYMSDNENMCNGEPNGDSNTGSSLYRYNDATVSAACPLGQWNDLPTPQVDVTGYVICSTNDAAPAPAKTCKAVRDANSFINASSLGITGPYDLDVDGTGPVATTPIWCDMTNDGGGWTLGFLKNSKHDSTYEKAGSTYQAIAGLGTSPVAASVNATTVAAIGSWLDLNAYEYGELKVGAYQAGAQTYMSDRILRTNLRINFGQNGYLLWDAPSASTPTTKYFWCGGLASYTDGGAGQVNKPAGAPDDCKGHGSLGSGWDFSNTGTAVNSGLTMCGNDASRWMHGTYASGTIFTYPAPGAAQAIWVR